MQNNDEQLGAPDVFGTPPSEDQLLEHPILPRLVPMEAAWGQPPESRIGERIKHARDELKLSAEALSRYTVLIDRFEGKGIGSVTLIRYERGETQPSARELRILADALNVSANWLLCGKLENRGESEAEQSLIAALRDYVHRVASTAAKDSGPTGENRNLLDAFNPLNAAARYRWIKEAKAARPRGIKSGRESTDPD